MRKKKKDSVDRHLTNVFYLNLKNKVISNHDKVFNPIDRDFKESLLDQDLFKINHKIDETLNDSNILDFIFLKIYYKKFFKFLNFR